MAKYILLGNLTEDGAERLRSHPGWIEETNRYLESMGIQVIAQYAVLGPYDIVSIIEAPDNKTVVRVSAELSMRGNLKITSLPALSIEEFLASLR